MTVVDQAFDHYQPPVGVWLEKDQRLSLRQPFLRKRWKGERLCAVEDSSLNASLAFDDCRIDFEGFS